MSSIKCTFVVKYSEGVKMLLRRIAANNNISIVDNNFDESFVVLRFKPAYGSIYLQHAWWNMCDQVHLQQIMT